MSLPTEPIGREETYLARIAGQDVELPPYPIGRTEEYLDYIAQHGGGGGASYEIKGAYDTEAELKTAHPTGNAGDAYLVGSPSHVYVWLTDDAEWHDAGAFTAIKGDKGDKGNTGATGADGLGIKSVDINSSNHLIVTYDDDNTHDAGAVNEETHTYSTTEHIVGTWIDGSPIYEKTINAGSLPDKSTSAVETISNLNYLIDIEGFAYSTTSPGNIRPLSFVGGSDPNNNIRVDVSDYVLRIITYNSTWTQYNAYLTIRYTKSNG